MYDIINEYNKASTGLKIKRKEYLWKWIMVGFRATTILNRSNKYYNESEKSKFISVLLIVLLDDLAENLQNKNLLNLANAIVLKEFDHFIEHGAVSQNTFLKPSGSYSPAEKKYLFFIQKTTRKILINLNSLPNFNPLKHVFCKYWQKVIECFDFTLNTNNFVKNQSVPKVEKYFKSLKYSRYTEIFGHNMHVILAMIIDLMCLTKIDKKEIKLIIKISEEAQAMGRIGNWLSTWKREIAEKDFSNGILIYSVNNRKIDIKDIKKYINKKNKKSANQLIKKIEESDVIDYFLNKWKKHRDKMEIMSKKVKIFPTDRYIKGADLFLKLHLKNEGKI